MSADSDSQRDPESKIRKIMTVFYPAWIGPGEMWWQVLEALGPAERFDEMANSLSAELRTDIREHYRRMKPIYFANYLAQPDREERRALLCSEFIAWCEKESDEGSQ